MGQRRRESLNHKTRSNDEGRNLKNDTQRETVMKTRLRLLVVFLAVSGSAAFPHGNKVHVRGTVEKTSADSLQVKTPQGKIVEVKLGAATVYLLHTADADKPAKLSDLAAGDLVVIHATPKGD